MITRYQIKILFIIVISFYPADLSAQSIDTTYEVNTFIGAGYSYYISTFDKYAGFNPHSYNLSFRIMWQPEHLLRIGIETGYISLYNLKQSSFESEFGTTEVKISLGAVPVFLVTSMEVFENFELSSGVGIYLLLTKSDFYENKVSSTVFSNGYYGAGSYYFPINEDIDIGAEVKFYYMSKIEDSDLTLQCVFKYNLLRY